jgi:hypothetical protein
MTAVSSVSTATNTLYALNTLLGNVSSQTAIQFYGLTGQYNGAVVAEKLVSPGVQELLLYKASSIQDQIRLQTKHHARSAPTSQERRSPNLHKSLNLFYTLAQAHFKCLTRFNCLLHII